LSDIKTSWNNEGVALYELKNYAGAIMCYENALEIDPKYVLALSNKDIAQKALDRDAEAKKH
jgi:tetratricopeptide (TPR) repeat protein